MYVIHEHIHVIVYNTTGFNGFIYWSSFNMSHGPVHLNEIKIAQV